MKIRKIDELCDLRNGHGFSSREWSTSGLPIIRIQNLNGSDEFNYYAGKVDKDWIVNPGDILFAWAGTRGVSFGAFRWQGPRGVLNQHIFKVIPKEGVKSDWLFPALRVITDRIERKAHGFKATLLHVKKGDIVNQTVYFPEGKECETVAKIMSDISQAVDIAEGQLNAGRQRRQALMQQLLTGKRRFPGFTKPWKRFTLHQFFSEVNETNADSRVNLPLSCSKVHGIVPQSHIFDKRVASACLDRYQIVRKGDLVYDPMLLWDGSIGFSCNVEIGVVSPAYSIFRYVGGHLPVEWFHYLFKSHWMRHQYAVISQGTNARRRKAPADAFLQIATRAPADPSEAAQIIKLLELVSNEIALLERLLTSHQRQKRALMQQLLTGKRRVRIPAQQE